MNDSTTSIGTKPTHGLALPPLVPREPAPAPASAPAPEPATPAADAFCHTQSVK